MTKQEKEYPVIEIFGPTIQGEGSLIGQPCYFIRFGGCDFRCTWCDSMYAVDPKQVKENRTMMTTKQILTSLELLPPGPNMVVLSGGNPALHDLTDLVTGIQQNTFGMGRWKVSVETQGTRWKPWLLMVDELTISPKGPSSKMSYNMIHLTDFILESLRTDMNPYHKVTLKVPVFDNPDYEFAVDINNIARKYKIPMYLSTGNYMAEGSVMAEEHNSIPKTLEELKIKLLDMSKWLSEKVMNDPRMANVRVTPQLHTLYWGNEQGK